MGGHIGAPAPEGKALAGGPAAALAHNYPAIAGNNLISKWIPVSHSATPGEEPRGSLGPIDFITFRIMTIL
jgi:hypothetical protein